MKHIFLFVFILTLAARLNAATYTAVASGNWNSGSTWVGGVAPGTDLSADQVVIPGGLTVTTNSGITINGVQGSLTVVGALTFSNNLDTLHLGFGNIGGAGVIQAGVVALDSNALLSFTGSLNTSQFHTASTGVQFGARLSVSDTMYLNGGILNFIVNSSLTLSNSSHLVISGGAITGDPNLFSLLTNYNVIYRGASVTSGIELNSLGFRDVIIDVRDSNTVSLSGDIDVKGNLVLQNGVFALNGHSIILSGNLITQQGKIQSNSSSNITVATAGTPTGALQFTGSGNTINNLAVNITGFNGMAKLGSDLNVNGALLLSSGSLHLGSNVLTIEPGASIMGAGASSYIITTDSGRLAMHVTAGAVDATRFHVGTGLHYAPAMVALSTGSASGMVMATVVDSVRVQGDTGTVLSNANGVVNATWHITSDISSNLNMSLGVMWSSSMEVNGFDRDSAYISHYTAGNWDSYMTGQATSVSGGMYSLTRTGITSLSPFTVFSKNVTTGIQAATGEVQLQVYPNPVADYLLVNAPASLNHAQVEILNLNGQTVKRFTINGAQTQLSLSDLNSGNYFVKVYNQQQVATSRFNKL